jgi:hypothetical protein
MWRKIQHGLAMRRPCGTNPGVSTGSRTAYNLRGYAYAYAWRFS